MEVLRVPPYPITTTWNLPLANHEYDIRIEDLVDHSIIETSETSDQNGVITYEIPVSQLMFDRQFSIQFFGQDGNLDLESNLDIIRPYTNPNDLGTTASEIADYKKWEIVARALIDTYTNIGFYNKKTAIQSRGTGSDYFPVWKDINRVLKVYENNVLVYDYENPELYRYEYKLTPDQTAIYKVDSGNTVLIDSPVIRLPLALGDTDFNEFDYGAFPKACDYIFIVDEGFRSIPPEIQYATELLIDDLKCGKLDYYMRYVTSYNTDQFRIQFDKKILEGTGNIIVDKILDRYLNSITRVGVL